MKNLLILLGLSAAITNPPKTVDLAPIEVSSNLFRINIHATNYSKSQLEKLDKAQEALWRVFNSPEFEASFSSRKAFTESQGLSNREVFKRLFKGSESLLPGDDKEMDLTVTMYSKRFSKVVGYTTPKSLTVFTNQRFHDNFSPCQVAANLSHEWAHKIGFDHKSAKDKDSVPYALGDMVLEHCRQLK